ncbi:hypothetical protein AAC387_Pa05g2062 [Persea americana]
MGHRGVVHFVMLGFSAMASAAGKSILSASGSLPPINAVTYMGKNKNSVKLLTCRPDADVHLGRGFGIVLPLP